MDHPGCLDAQETAVEMEQTKAAVSKVQLQTLRRWTPWQVVA
jgi:hypothetical protein